MERPIIYTVGHSTHQLDFFLELIQSFEVNCLVDVRSVPASAYNQQYNQASLKDFLSRNQIRYLHFADEFGAMKSDGDLLNEDGKLDFEKVRKTRMFHQGLERIWQGVKKGYIIALMCSESEPLDCHRYSLVSIGLEDDGFDVRHILKDKSIVTNRELENELLKKYAGKIPQKTLFEPDVSIEEQLKAALKLINKEIGFSPYSTWQERETYD